MPYLSFFATPTQRAWRFKSVVKIQAVSDAVKFDMARPREFDKASVLDAAVQRFEANGYETTSIRNLADRMEITGASHAVR